MKHTKRFIALAATAAMISLSCHTADATEYSADIGGCGYQECRETPCLTPAIALGTIALVAIVAVALQDSKSSHSHCHN
jgi:hypothetical protein